MFHQPVYVIDTNILVDYVDIIPNGANECPEKPTINLTSAHVVIPTAVIRELSNFKKERTTDRDRAAQTTLKRIRSIVENSLYAMEEVCSLRAPILLKNGEQLISVFSVHADFKSCLPYRPSEDDMDGLLAVLSAAFSMQGLPIDGTASPNKVMNFRPTDVTLLTNDNGLAIRARDRGLPTSRYSYKVPPPYTGRRDIDVPYRIFISKTPVKQSMPKLLWTPISTSLSALVQPIKISIAIITA